MKLTQEEIGIAAKQFTIAFGVASAVLFVASKIFIHYWDEVEWCVMAAFMATYMCDGLLAFCLISFGVWIYIDWKKKDDANKERINELESTVQELQSKKDQIRKGSPLINLTDEQQTAIEGFLYDLPIHTTKGEAINMKEWARFIRALEDMGYISVAKSADTRGLRDWVILLADGKSVPNPSAFNQAIRNATQANINDAINKLEKILNSDKQ